MIIDAWTLLTGEWPAHQAANLLWRQRLIDAISRDTAGAAGILIPWFSGRISDGLRNMGSIPGCGGEPLGYLGRVWFAAVKPVNRLLLLYVGKEIAAARSFEDPLNETQRYIQQDT